jgi:alkane 1-monooxygenase
LSPFDDVVARCALGNTIGLAQHAFMNTAPCLPTPASTFRDRKRWGWLLSVVGPGVAAIGTLAHTLDASSLWWFAAPLVLLYLVVPIADWPIGEDLTNPPESQVPALEADGYCRSIL